MSATLILPTWRHLKHYGCLLTPKESVSPRGMRIKEAAEYMAASCWYVEERIRSKELPALKLGRHYVLLREDLDAFLDKQRKSIETERLHQQGRAA